MNLFPRADAYQAQGLKRPPLSLVALIPRPCIESAW